MPDPIKKAIAGCHLFAACGEEEIARLAAIAQQRAHRRGDVVFNQRERADAFHLATEGIFRVLRVTGEGQEVHLHVIRSGEIFGLVPFFFEKPYPAQAICSTARGATIRFPRTPFLKLMTELPDLPRLLLGGLAAKLHEFTQRIEAITVQTLPTRLARWLLLDFEGGTLPMSKRNLAAHLGATPEALSRAFRSLAEDGLIAISGSSVTVVDQRRLTETAGLSSLVD